MKWLKSAIFCCFTRPCEIGIFRQIMTLKYSPFFSPYKNAMSNECYLQYCLWDTDWSCADCILKITRRCLRCLPVVFFFFIFRCIFINEAFSDRNFKVIRVLIGNTHSYGHILESLFRSHEHDLALWIECIMQYFPQIDVFHNPFSLWCGTFKNG